MKKPRRDLLEELGARMLAQARAAEQAASEPAEPQALPIDQIRPRPGQPRRRFD